FLVFGESGSRGFGAVVSLPKPDGERIDRGRAAGFRGIGDLRAGDRVAVRIDGGNRGGVAAEHAVGPWADVVGDAGDLFSDLCARSDFGAGFRVVAGVVQRDRLERTGRPGFAGDHAGGVLHGVYRAVDAGEHDRG